MQEVEQTEQPEGSSKGKARAKRGVCKVAEVGPKSHWIITAVGPTSEPVAPRKAAAKYKTIIGALVRENISISFGV